jgi:uncharacterized repeat protein (TIGR02543 family)
MKKIFVVIITVIVLFSPFIASAATFCVDTSQELQDALTTAQSNSQNDTIQIVQGTYTGNFVYESTQSHSLTIQGGYTAGCASRVVNASNTVLDANSTGRVLMLNSPSATATYIVNGITLTHGELFYENPADYEPGAGLYVDTQSGSLSLTNSIIIDNTTVNSQGGGIYVTNAESVEITNATFTRNTSAAAGGAGGGIYIQGVTGTINLDNNSFTDGWAFDGSGGIEISALGTINVTNNTFTGNFSDMGSGAAYIGGAGTITMTNNIISHNTSDTGYGGGVFLAASGTLNFSNNTVAYNDTPNAGTGMIIDLHPPGVANIYNNIIWHNYSYGPDREDDLVIGNPAGTTVNLFNNNFDQSSWTSPIDPSNLNNVDPLFVNAAGGNFRLRFNSPVINMGSNSAPGLPDYDFDGLPRILYGIVDMGAYEYSSGNCTLTATKAGTGSGDITGEGLSCSGSTCTGTYTCGVSVTLGASASTGSTFTSWAGCDATDGNTCTVTMNGNESVTATFTLTQRTLSVGKSGTGSGRVTGTGINCGSDCGESYNYGTVVTLTATPDPGSTFSGWTGCDSTDENTCSVTMTANKAVNASFTLTQYTLTATKTGTGSGTLTASGLSCVGNTCTGTFGYNYMVTITASAASGSMLSDWIGCDDEDGSTCTVTMTSDKTVVATFALIPPDTHVLTVEKRGSGTVTGIGISCGTDCTEAYEDGTVVILTAFPGPGFVFTGWSGGCSGTNTCEITMNGNITVTATFTSASTKEYKLTIGKKRINKGDGLVESDDGGISCGTTCSGLYHPNAPITLRATPLPGSLFEGWTPTSLNCGTSPTCSFTMDTKHKVKAIFRGPYRLLTKIKSKNNGSGSVTADISGIGAGINCPTFTCEDYYPYDTNVVLTAQPGGGSQFMGWKPSSLECGTNLTCTVPMTKKQSVTATFEGM